ncbi:MAG: hypothetical protein ACFCD0_09805 [Gemmataceae bacterium]
MGQWSSMGLGRLTSSLSCGFFWNGLQSGSPTNTVIQLLNTIVLGLALDQRVYSGGQKSEELGGLRNPKRVRFGDRTDRRDHLLLKQVRAPLPSLWISQRDVFGTSDVTGYCSFCELAAIDELRV